MEQQIVDLIKKIIYLTDLYCKNQAVVFNKRILDNSVIIYEKYDKNINFGMNIGYYKNYCNATTYIPHFLSRRFITTHHVAIPTIAFFDDDSYSSFFVSMDQEKILHFKRKMYHPSDIDYVANNNPDFKIIKDDLLQWGNTIENNNGFRYPATIIIPIILSNNLIKKIFIRRIYEFGKFTNTNDITQARSFLCKFYNEMIARCSRA